MGPFLLTWLRWVSVPDAGWKSFRKTPLLQRPRLSPTAQFLRVWLLTIKGPSTPLIKHANRPNVRRICEPIVTPYPITMFTNCAHNEATHVRILKPLFARG